MNGDEKLTIAEVAAELKVCDGTVKGWIQEGKLKAIKLGYHTVRIYRRDLEEFLADRYGSKYFMLEEVRQE